MISGVFRPTIITLAVLFSAMPSFAAKSSRPPNFVVVLMDDIGWHDVGFMGNKFVETLERLKLTDNTVVIFTSDNGGTPADEHPRYYRALDFHSRPEKDAALQAILVP